MRYVVGAATWAGALRAAVDGLAACGWYCRHARGAKLVQIALYLNGHYGAGCCVRRALHVACMDQDSRITLALGYQRGFIVHLGALDGPAKWLCL